ncbi:MAG: GH92 family glycosyl hydrolase [Bacteroidota bacterium]
MKKSILFFFVGLLFLGCNSSNKPEKEKDLSKYVNPFIGTDGHGHTFPGASVPFSMVQLSPDNGWEGWDWSSGYHYSKQQIIGFSHTHLSGTGVGDMLDILVMPTLRDVVTDTTGQGKGFMQSFVATFSHANEQASPGYYSVKFNQSDILAEITSTKRAGFHRYTFPNTDFATILLDLGWSVNFDEATDTYIKVTNDSTSLTGYRFSKGWAAKQKVFFAAKFSKKINSLKLVKNGVIQAANNEVRAKHTAASLYFDNPDKKPILLKVGISSVSEEGALNNLNSEIDHWDFDKTKQDARNSWNEELAKIYIKTPDIQLKTNFYSSMYHLMLAPNLYSDVDGKYRALNDNIEKAEGYEKYFTFSLWDTFRAAHPLFTIIQPEKTDDFIESMLSHYFNNPDSLLPIWSLWGNETETMIGYHAVPVIVDAWLKGLNNFNGLAALNAMKKTANNNRKGIEWYKTMKYIPADKEKGSVSKTVEYAYDDWCIARMAENFSDTATQRIFDERATYYKNVFDTETKFMRPKLADGNWKEKAALFNSGYDNDYTEGNAWQYTWFVPHQIEELIEMMGGNEAFVKKLDSLFTASPVEGEKALDMSGFIGQYVHGNEPSHHVAYLYNFAGAPKKTQQTVRTIMDKFYKPTPEGLIGNEDCGQMSAWYLFSALGFYPVNPVGGNYQIGSPIVQAAEISLPNDKVFKIRVLNQGDKNIYVQSASLNGKRIDNLNLKHEQIMAGGELVFEMTNKPIPRRKK